MHPWFRFAKTSRKFVACRVGKGGGTAVLRGNADRTPCPPWMVRFALMPLVGTAHESLCHREKCSANAFAHPTRLCITLSQKKFGPCLRLWARGRPHSCLFASP